MSQQPRRRRRRRRGRGGSGDKGRPQGDAAVARQQEPSGRASQAAGEKGRTGRRRRRRGAGSQGSSPQSSEDLVRAQDKARPESLMLPPDDRRLEEIIGQLQSEWGVPQSPQEYRITLKVSEERGRGARSSDGGPGSEDEGEQTAGERPLREKAPAAPRMGEGQPGAREAAPARKKRSRRRRRRGKGGAST